MQLFAVIGDAGSSGIPSFLTIGTIEEVVEAAEADWERYAGDIPEDQPLGEPGETVYSLWTNIGDEWVKTAHADTLSEIRGWARGEK